MSAKSGLGICVALALAIGGCSSDTDRASSASGYWLSPAGSGSYQPAPATSSATTYSPDEYRAALAAAAPKIRVSRVIDGDTFELPDGTRVRVLGIDSCEMSTPAGQEALTSAKFWLDNKDIVLTSEPGVDLDRYGRKLRYVNAGGVDFGKSMVSYPHTGVYGGKNGANPAYIAELRGLDTGGRTCKDAPAPIVQNDDNYVPMPNGNDDDHKSRFCRRHWYC
ncbi:MAG TPA: thermonuclease family protein [Pseudonocardia sp.]